MTCAHCSAAGQRGRFCVGCGRKLPFALRPVRPARIPAPRALDETQPVLRFEVPPSHRAAVPVVAP
ncbi:hypothetical protein OF117_02315 [Geodermatophilus sp. YIM 151500]|uniref:hypothetical protein n=1 Tax=Geodermatophilus sp. YIM 151500 TaxID=2984531 RepID=UPI0021E39534|nr:hypothetical protein [Geodermatophilus sp. YIM 151500]MCV2488186.1 hypothetical protein [Geodermatophilus sp. YIM 151500]